MKTDRHKKTKRQRTEMQQNKEEDTQTVKRTENRQIDKQKKKKPVFDFALVGNWTSYIKS